MNRIFGLQMRELPNQITGSFGYLPVAIDCPDIFMHEKLLNNLLMLFRKFIWLPFNPNTFDKRHCRGVNLNFPILSSFVNAHTRFRPPGFFSEQCVKNTCVPINRF